MRRLFFLIFIFSSLLSNAQYFEAFGNGHGINSGGTVYALSGDSTNHLLYVLGIFQTSDDTGYNGNCVWNGTQYDSLFNFFNVPITIPHVAKWGDTTVIVWDHSIRLMNGKQLLQALPQTDGEINAVCILNNELYIAGAFGNAGGITVGGIAKWNGINWENLGAGLTGVNSYSVDALGAYNGELIAGGMFDEIDGLPVNNIARWNGFQWDSLGAGILWTGGLPFIQSIREFQNELWIGGGFDSAGNISCNGLVKWDGFNWAIPSNCPIQLLFHTSIEIYHNKLYIASRLHNSDYTKTGYIVSYDGIQFDYLPLDNAIAWNGLIFSMGVFDDFLYVGGTFDTLGIPTYGIARFTDDSINGLHEIPFSHDKIAIYPNPATDELTFEVLNGIAPKEIEIINTVGVTVMKSKQTKSHQQINIKLFASGVYFIKIKMQDGSVTVIKFVKE